MLRDRGVRVEVLPAEAGRVPLEKVLLKLGEEGILTLLTETGTRLNTAFLPQASSTAFSFLSRRRLWAPTLSPLSAA